MVGTSTHSPKGCRFDPQSGHAQEATDGCFSHRCVSLPFSLPLSLENNEWTYPRVRIKGEKRTKQRRLALSQFRMTWGCSSALQGFAGSCYHWSAEQPRGRPDSPITLRQDGERTDFRLIPHHRKRSVCGGRAPTVHVVGRKRRPADSLQVRSRTSGHENVSNTLPLRAGRRPLLPGGVLGPVRDPQLGTRIYDRVALRLTSRLPHSYLPFSIPLSCGTSCHRESLHPPQCCPFVTAT